MGIFRRPYIYCAKLASFISSFLLITGMCKKNIRVLPVLWYVFGPPGSGSISQEEVEVRIRILPFSDKCVERTDKVPAKYGNILTQKF
jgi:hypothetical protein